jgi:hypothetical protein
MVRGSASLAARPPRRRILLSLQRVSLLLRTSATSRLPSFSAVFAHRAQYQRSMGKGWPPRRARWRGRPCSRSWSGLQGWADQRPGYEPESPSARARRGSVVSDPVTGGTARQRLLAHLAAVEHPPQILSDAGARESRRVLELGLRDARSLTHECEHLLPGDFTLGRRARAPARTRPPGTAPPRLRPTALRLAGACPGRRTVGKSRFSLLKAFVFANQWTQLIQPCPQLRANGIK